MDPRPDALENNSGVSVSRYKGRFQEKLVWRSTAPVSSAGQALRQAQGERS